MPEKGPRTVAARLQTRIAHLQRLQDPQHGLTIAQANAAFRRAHADGSAPESIHVRRHFLRRTQFLKVEGDRDRTPRMKPPLATALRSRGVLLRLELTLLFLAQCRPAGQRTPKVTYPVISRGDSQLGLIDFLATGTNRRPGTKFRRMPSTMRAAQVHRALDSMAGKGLQLLEIAKTASARPDYDQGVLLHTEVGPTPIGDQKPYVVPRLMSPGRTPTVSIPIEFFTNGWLHVLTDSEIANWLMWRDVGEMRTADWSSADDLMIWAEERLGWYDLSRDVWDTHQMLSRLGLMSTTFADDRRSDGTLTDYSSGRRGEPHTFGVDDQELAKQALPAALAAVAAARDEAQLH